MVALTDVRAHNTSLKSLSPGLVAVFVGGTSGIGFSTAREFVRNSNSPHVYLIGRNKDEASRIISELQSINPSSKLDFIQSDVSLLQNVDTVCKQIKEKETKLNILFMTCGMFTLSGRDETAEGLDKKFALHYYSRLRFIQNLSPLLSAAGNDPDTKVNLSRVVSVLDPNQGRKLAPNFSDLSLKNNFSLKNCATHASSMNNFSHEHFAKLLPNTSFVHIAPLIVATGVSRDLGPLMRLATTLLKPFAVDLTESGERHLFAATAPRYAPKALASSVEEPAMGSDDVNGSGAYTLQWTCETAAESKKMQKLREEGAGKKIWDHTEEVFKIVCEELGKY